MIHDKRYDVVALGELLIDFTPAGKSSTGMNLFEQNPGGAPANVLTILSKQGFRTAFVGKLGNDIHGRFLKKTLDKENIDTNAIVFADDCFTTLAFVELAENGERTFSFARKPGADIMLKKEELDDQVINNCTIFHVGSISLTDEPSKTATFEAVKRAKKSGAIISYDPNYRPSLWKSKESAMEEMRAMLLFVDMIKISDEEMELLTGENNLEKAAEYLHEKGITLVAITLGSEGAYISLENGGREVPGYPCNPIDTTGAGDSFWGGFLSRFLSENKKLPQVGLDDAIGYARYGNAAASLCVEKRGAIPAMPTKEEVQQKIGKVF